MIILHFQNLNCWNNPWCNELSMPRPHWQFPPSFTIWTTEKISRYEEISSALGQQKFSSKPPGGLEKRSVSQNGCVDSTWSTLPLYRKLTWVSERINPWQKLKIPFYAELKQHGWKGKETRTLLTHSKNLSRRKARFISNLVTGKPENDFAVLTWRKGKINIRSLRDVTLPHPRT